MGAEFVNAATAFGSIMLADSVFKMPMEDMRKHIAKAVVLPALGWYEDKLELVPSLQTPEYRELKKTGTPEQRAYWIADMMLDTGVMTGSGMVGQAIGQAALDPIFGVPDLNWKGHAKVIAADRVTNMLGILLLNTALYTPSLKLQGAVSDLLYHQMGISKENAESRASYIVNWQLPNILGMVAAIFTHHKLSSASALGKA